jgi:threonine/homoserine/homoserine lactone efflux protein
VDIPFLLRGVLLGFSIAAPVGPIGVLCIRRTLSEGRAAGLASGLGAATADAFYGCVAAFGLTFISGFLLDQRLWLNLMGGAFLLYLGARTFASKPSETATIVGGQGLLGHYASTLFLTLTNPMTILSFTAIFAGMGLAATTSSYADAGALVLGVFAGSALWWLALSLGVGALRAKFNLSALRWVNRLSGLIVLGFGFYSLSSLL